MILLAVFLPGVAAVNSSGQEMQKPAGAEMQSWKTYQVFFEESGPADDNPWGVTAGIIDSGGDGECILLTPGTAVDLMDMDLSVKFLFRMKIHPLTWEISDGVCLDISLLDKEDEILYQDTVLLESEENWSEYAADLSSYKEEAARIRVACRNAEEDHADGDWLILSFKGDTVPDTAEIVQWSEYTLGFENPSASMDNPWGFNEGIMEEEETGNCIFMTPGTAVDFLDWAPEAGFSLTAAIYPKVAHVSDGLKVRVQFFDSWDDMTMEKEIYIDPSGEWESLDIDPQEDIGRIRIECGNEDGRNEDGDWLIIKNHLGLDSTFGRKGYVRSATYFGDEWPINFWNSDNDHLAEDMARIKADGFDSIILVIPWKEFQPGTDPVVFNEYPFEKLKKIMEASSREDLDVYVRIGYYWDYYNDSDEVISERFLLLLSDEKMLSAWQQYASRLYRELSRYDHFAGGFLTWEDFWGILDLNRTTKKVVRLRSARRTGYQKWVEQRYTLEGYNKEYGCSYETIAKVPVPNIKEPSMKAMYEFYDEFLNRILKDTQEVFPNISMEVRIDADLVWQADGTAEYYYHTGTYTCSGSDYTAVMYGIPMGFENHGERVTASETLERTSGILGGLSREISEKPVYIEQFLFMDNTPLLTQNAQLLEEEVPVYLESAAEVLKKYSRGYGIWTYRNYRNNMLYNNGFALGGEGWETEGSVQFITDDQSTASSVCLLRRGASIMQKVPDIRNHYDNDAYEFEFEVISVKEPGMLRVCMGSTTEEIEIRAVGKYAVKLEKDAGFDLAVTDVDGEFALDDLCMYSFTQDGGLYDVGYTEEAYIGSIRKLNRALAGDN